MEKAQKEIFSLSPEEVALQITLSDYESFKRIDLIEITRQNWSKNKKSAPNVIRMINDFNNSILSNILIFYII